MLRMEVSPSDLFMGIFTRNVAKESHQHQKLNFHEHKWFSLHMKAYHVEGI